MKLSEIKAGDVIVIDDSHPLIQAGEHVVGQDDDGLLFVINEHGNRVHLSPNPDGYLYGVLRKV